MKRTTTITAAIITATLAATGCASTTTTTQQASPATATTTTQATPTPAGPFYNMSTLAADLKLKVTQEIAKDGLTGSVTSMTCILTGSQTAECNASYSDGETASVTAYISADGDTYVTGAGN